MLRVLSCCYPACLALSLLTACGAEDEPGQLEGGVVAAVRDAAAAPAQVGSADSAVTAASDAGSNGALDAAREAGSDGADARVVAEDARALTQDSSSVKLDAEADVGPGSSDAAQPDAAGGAALWLSPNGSDTNPGTKQQPLKTLAAAHERALPGMTIWVGPGTYASAQTVALRTSGKPGQPIAVFAEPGARPVFDFAAQARGQSSARGLQISASYWHIRGIDVIKAGDNCIHISGSYNTIEHVVTHGCDDTGIQITANGSEAGDATRAAHNTILNCDSYENYDSQNQGENADGFAAKLYIGPGNVFRGCRAWNNSDDGWDLFASDDVVVIENCWAISNGKIGPSQSNTNGDGNGFKLGGAAAAGDANQGGAPHRVSGCVSISNRACGFVRNNNTSVPALSMCAGQGDGKGAFCSLSSTGGASITLSAAAAIAAQRAPDGSLPAM